VAAHPFPAHAVVARPEESAAVVRGLEDRVDDVRVLRRQRQPDAAEVRVSRESRLRLLPRLAAIRRSPERRLRPTRDIPVRATIALPRAREQHVVIARIDYDVARTRPGAAVENLLPALSAVGRLIKTPLSAGGGQW